MDKGLFRFQDIKEHFGSNVFTDSVMKSRISAEAYAKYREVLDSGKELERETADEIASAMKDWAIAKGATHYTHWFQPLTGTTAEKHDSFLEVSPSGDITLDFSGKQLIRGETDASSFPSGGTRATFEARGYTVWDCTSPAFVRSSKNGSTVLCIPTAFCSYKGEALDKKTPLLRAMQALNTQAMRVLRLLGDEKTKKVVSNLGAEQEYFLIKKEHYNKRKDLIFTGRTLFGAKPPKGQELHDQYYASIRDCVSTYMNELNFELWRLGISAKTQHNEAAPSQHELAPIYTTTNIATDHNQLIMETMKRVADRNGLSCILHEKPFEGVNGSGKHNNWSLCTNDGQNLLYPGNSPKQNYQFLLFFTAILAGVNEYADLLRMSAAYAGNDHRLGGFEAPPAIISVYIGEDLQQVLSQLENNDLLGASKKKKLNIGVSTLPSLSCDYSDRNRTSPFAFTGNKFEFRMVGSSCSTATPNVILSLLAAEYLMRAADRLQCKKGEERNKELLAIIQENIIASKPVLFSGNNYSAEWVSEAKRRGLSNFNNAVDAYECLTVPKNIQLFLRHGVMSEREINSRQEIYYENYIKTIHIEAQTMLCMANEQLLPTGLKYLAKLNTGAMSAKQQGLTPTAQVCMAKQLQEIINCFYANIQTLHQQLEHVQQNRTDNKAEAKTFRDKIIPIMNELRKNGDAIEGMLPKEILPYPSYADLLFYD